MLRIFAKNVGRAQTYVPIGVHQPVERKKKIIDTGRIRYIVTSNEMRSEEDLGVSVICLEAVLQKALPAKEPGFPETNQPAYIILHRVQLVYLKVWLSPIVRPIIQ